MKNSVKVGIIPAAGRGNRMGYLGQLLPKVLLPVYDRPIIHHVIDNMKSVGVEQIHVIVRYKKELVMEYLDSVRDKIGVAISFIEQPRLSGIAAAVLLSRDLVNEPFIIMLGDDCTVADSLENIVNAFYDHEALLVEGLVMERDTAALRAACCLQLGKDGRIIEITEKPKNPTSHLRGCGIYVCQPEVFDYIERTPVSPLRGEVEITQTVALIAREGRAYGEFLRGANINVNSCPELLYAGALMKHVQENLQFTPQEAGGISPSTIWLNK